MTHRSPTLRVRARGPLAIFTRPELKVERVSYPVMTPSAARGLLEAVLWKPAMRWHIERITVLKPIAFTSFRRNEVNTRAVVPPVAVVNEGGAHAPYFADEDRAQRSTMALRDVDYLIDAHLTLTEKVGPGETTSKFVEMFQRRLEKGQHFQQPYLGCRECVADVFAAEGHERPIEDSRELGLMLWDIAYGGPTLRAQFFTARLDHGVMVVPPTPEVSTLATGGAS